MNRNDRALLKATVEAYEQLTRESRVITESQSRQRAELLQRLQALNESPKHRILDQLSAASSIAVALTAITALVISLISFQMQSQDRASSAQKSQKAFANRIVPWWTMGANTNANSFDLHISNDNPLPVNVWVMHLPEDNQLPPGLYRPKAATKLTAVYSSAGPVPIIPYVFIAAIPPCTEIDVNAPFAFLHMNIQPSPSLIVGDIVFTDPSGYIWAKSPSGSLREISYSSINRSSENLDILRLIVITNSDFGPYPIKWTHQHQSSTCG